VLVKEMEAPLTRAQDERIQVIVQVDDLAPRRLKARLVAEPGDSFIFVQVLNGFPFDSLKGHRMLAITLPNGYRTRFSLAGFEDAWTTAQEVCESFLAP
jgi:hypothetical protein